MNPRLARIAPSLIRAINARKRPGDIDLGLGEPTLRPDTAAFEAAVAWVRENGCPYSPNAGFPTLREAIATHHRLPDKESGTSVCVTVGSEEAIYLAIKTLIDPDNDEVLIVEPCYLAYPKLCTLEGIRHRSVALPATSGFRPNAAAVLEAIEPATRLIILNSPSNPTGRIWPRRELEALAAGLQARPGPPVHVLSDEVYRELVYDEGGFTSLAELYPHAVVAGSLSKSSALTGLRLGWLIAAEDVIQGAVKIHQFVNTAADSFAQRVALSLFAEAGALARHAPLYRQQREVLLESLGAARIEHIVPEGAFYCMVRLPDPSGGDSIAAAEGLLETERVVTVPGRAFGASAEGWLRLSWVADASQLREGIARIGRYFETGAGES